MCAIIAELCWRDCCISAIRFFVGSNIGFGRELWLGGVSGVGDVNINESRERKVGGFVLVRLTEIMFDIRFLG